MKLLPLLLFTFLPGLAFAQLGFCSGSKGDPIFHEDFGPGFGTGPPLAVTTTNYTYVTGDPNDGEYTISGRVGQNNNTWHSYLPPTTISRGRALVVNANFTSGLFYTTIITGLCENSSYEFSAYLINVYNLSSGACSNGGIPINVRFEIWDNSNTVLLKSGSTGNIASSSNPVWQQYALTFQSGPGQGAVILKMFNNGVGGCGNDLAIDDIIFRSCGDLTEIIAGEQESSPLIVCEASPPSNLTLTANPDHSIYKSHFFQWQQSGDGSSWLNIPGENREMYTVSEINTTQFYRVKVAEDEINLNNNLCSTASEVFEVRLISTPAAPESSGNIITCINESWPALSVTVGENEIVNWYDASSNGALLKERSTTFRPEVAGTYYAEAVNKNGCLPGPRTAVELIINPVPATEDEILELCNEGTLELGAGISDLEYQWSTGEIGERINISSGGSYHVIITTALGCRIQKNFEVRPVIPAEISEIISDENGVSILTINQGNFEYSLDGVNYQRSPNFRQIPGGVYTAYVRDLNLCRIVSMEFPHIVIQKYFSPNSDGVNDRFILKGVEYFNSSQIFIYNRYGKLIKTGEGINFTWDGTFNNEALPADDYWYEIYIENFKKVKGHITLLR